MIVIRKLSWFYNKLKINRVKYYIFSILASLILTIIWFKSGMLATAEEGMPFYDLERSLRIYSSAFYDTGLGISGIFNIPRIPIFLILTFLNKLGFTALIIQASLFFFLILIPLIVFPKLVKEVMEKEQNVVGYIAAIFYLFNLFTLSQVLTRFVLSLIFLWSYLPLFLYLWIIFLKTKNIKYLIFLLISSLIYSYQFLIISPLVTLWICAFLYSCYLFLKTKDKGVLINALIACVIWLIFNSWWIYYFWQVKETSTTNLDSKQNLVSLLEVSNYFPNLEVMSLRQKYMFGQESPYFEFYKKENVKNLSLLALVIVIYGAYTAIKKKYWYFLILLIIAWIIVKGANPPMGKQLYTFLFENISLWQVYRNPYEKFGSVFLMSYSTLFALGLVTFANKFRRVKYIVLFVAIITFCGYLVLPMWNGNLFKNTYYVKVPTYYHEANNYLKYLGSEEERILQLPFLRKSNIAYDWNYFGEEPSEFLFDMPSVSRTLSNPTYDAFYYKLGDPEFFYNNPDYSNLLAIMNVQYIILHKDILLDRYFQEDENFTRRIIMDWKGVKHDKDFGKLEIYSLDNDKLSGRIYLSDNLLKVQDLSSAFSLITSSNFDSMRDSVFIEKQNVNAFTEHKDLRVPGYNVKKLAKTSYEVHIDNAREPFILILANNYSTLWKAEIDGSLLANHFVVNGFANGWIIDKTGNYTIDINYKVWPWD